MSKIDPRFRIAYMLSKQKSEISVLAGITALIMSFGFFFAQPDLNDNYLLIYNFANQYVWSAIFAIYGIVKLVGYFFLIPFSIRMLAGIIGIWAWNYIFLSFTVFDTSPIAPTEYLLIVPSFAEFWNMLGMQKDLRSKDNASSMDNVYKEENHD
jgi:hypothetical protein